MSITSTKHPTSTVMMTVSRKKSLLWIMKVTCPSVHVLLLLFVACLGNDNCQLLAFSVSSATFSEKPVARRATKSSDDQQQHQQHQQQHPPTRNHYKKKKNRRQDSLNVGRDPLLSLNLNLDAMARANAAERAQELYQRISALHEEGYYAAAPDVVSFNTVLKAYQTDPAKAISFWETTVGESLVEPNTRSFNIILLALAKAGLHEEAMDVLRQMQSPESLVIPDCITFNTVLLAFVKANEPAQAEMLLQEMINIGKSGNSVIHPDVYSFNTVLACWSQQGFPDRAQALLDTMKKTAAMRQEEHKLQQQAENGNKMMTAVRPDVYSYTTVIHAWAKTGNSTRAMELFQEMTGPPNHLRPNKITYTALVQVLCNDGKPEKAQLLVCDMLQRAAAAAAQSARSNSNNNNNDKEDEQEEVSEEDFLPDAVLFSILIHGWANVADFRPEQALRAVLLILKDMTTFSKTWPRMAPNSITYIAVFAALAKTRQWDAPEEALKVLRSMTNDNGGSSGGGGIRPTIVHYNAALDVYAKSSRADKAIRAAELWKELDELQKQQQQESNGQYGEQSAAVIPDLITFNTLLACAANSFGDDKLKAQSLEVGLAAFKALRNSSSTFGVDNEQSQSQQDCSEVRPYCQPPSSLTYHYLFKMLRKFMQPPSKRHNWMKRAFESCCQEGCLNQLVLDQVLSHITTEEAQDMLGSEYVSFDNNSGVLKVLLEDLPDKWSRNALTCSPSSSRRPSSFRRKPQLLQGQEQESINSTIA